MAAKTLSRSKSTRKATSKPAPKRPRSVEAEVAAILRRVARETDLLVKRAVKDTERVLRRRV